MANGREWEVHLPPSKRPKKERTILDGYSAGDAKIMRTTLANIPRGHFVCLLQVDALMEEGLKMVPHGQPKK
eukprot:4953415-Pyramimonas_sp.AAC.1